ncbi:expressed unknown protein [Seminavis robusta]|uniref:Methyltransferase type 11 domain-containing protein n=1 Tax=Seminavis robusta TaxID=568900 RepID=A0A9N8HRS1_9STRA|nr:expressed unknown protein [Seminavis robusta]|eukprot:Sro1612_g285960.1 n/a (368) ;mRNA; f:7382-8862
MPRRSQNQQWQLVTRVFLSASVFLLLFKAAHWNHERVVRALDSTDLREIAHLGDGGAGQPLRSALDIPPGQAVALPSIRVEQTEEEIARGQYGGKGDKKHLGGFTTYDGQGVTPQLWKHMISDFGVKSLVDVGCGKGDTLWFLEHGVDVLCVEGSHDAVEQTLLPDPASQVVEHDFSRGPYWPAETYDAVWSVEFLEHVGRQFQHNYIQTFRKAALIFVSHSHWGGWHHVEVHDHEYWIDKFEAFGFKYSGHLTEQVRSIARTESNQRDGPSGPDGKPLNAQHVWLTMQVFINPMVAALPKHAHLFSEHGCFKERAAKGKIIHKECGTLRGGNTESKMPESFYPLKLTAEQDEAWLAKVKASISSAV